MCECLYNYLVIEHIGQGIHALVEEDYWAEWDDLAGKWTPLQERPKSLLGITNFAIG
jgi:hypothetical protein